MYSTRRTNIKKTLNSRLKQKLLWASAKALSVCLRIVVSTVMSGLHFVRFRIVDYVTNMIALLFTFSFLV